MLRGRRVGATVVTVVLGSCAVAVAAVTGSPVAEPVQAQIVFDHVAGKSRSCAGADGRTYFESIYTVTGTATGTEELSGDVSFRVHAFVNDAGVGVDRAAMRILDPETGVWRARGSVANAYTPDIAQGIITGQTRIPPNTGERFRLFAGFRVTFNDDGSVTAQIGGEVADTRLPAVQVGGRCGGPFEPFEADIPAPGGQATSRGSRSPGGLGA
jgi:hypothetical protein